MKKRNFYLTDKQYDSLKELKKKTGANVAELVRRFIDKGIKSYK